MIIPVSLSSWQLWTFSMGLALVVASPVIIVAIVECRKQKRQSQLLLNQPPKQKTGCFFCCITNSNQACCPQQLRHLKGHRCDVLSNELHQETQTIKTEQSQIG